MITREQVADLQPGDIVELHVGRWGSETTLRGPLWSQSTGGLFLGDVLVQHGDGRINSWEDITLTVVSRAPRPLYVNHPRTEPVPGDVARCGSNGHLFTYLYTGRERYAGVEPHGRMTGWVGLPGCGPDTGPLYANERTLLVDGETGMTVPS